mmetsp:Transcript_4495/g.14669  ORF Transcript_4495/g.14669 Transcript_4495/m.14669 type:complete len:207 (-) Transcript_4495:1464-2084(-)
MGLRLGLVVLFCANRRLFCANRCPFCAFVSILRKSLSTQVAVYSAQIAVIVSDILRESFPISCRVASVLEPIRIHGEPLFLALTEVLPCRPEERVHMQFPLLRLGEHICQPELLPHPARLGARAQGRRQEALQNLGAGGAVDDIEGEGTGVQRDECLAPREPLPPVVRVPRHLHLAAEGGPDRGLAGARELRGGSDNEGHLAGSIP